MYTYAICAVCTFDKDQAYSWEKPILSSEMLHKDYDRKGTVSNKISGRDTQGARLQDELIGGKPQVVK
jgi:hypothetical protein